MKFGFIVLYPFDVNCLMRGLYGYLFVKSWNSLIEVKVLLSMFSFVGICQWV